MKMVKPRTKNVLPQHVWQKESRYGQFNKKMCQGHGEFKNPMFNL